MRLLKSDYFEKWIENLEGDHRELVREEQRRRTSSTLEYIESYYISNPSGYTRKKIFAIGGLSVAEKEHIASHIEFIIYGAIKTSKTTEIILDSQGRLRRRRVSNRKQVRLPKLDPATRSILIDLIRDREYSL